MTNRDLEASFGQALEERLIRAVEGVDGTRSADGGNATLLGLLVNNTDQGISDEIVAQLTLNNSRAKALIHKLAPGFFAAFQILAHSCI